MNGSRQLEIAERREADDAKRARYYQLIGELSSIHNEVTGEFSALFSFLLGADWKMSTAILKDYRHLDQKVGLIDRIVGLGEPDGYVIAHWDAIKAAANSLNNRRGKLIHAGVTTLLHEESGTSTVAVLAMKPGRMYSEREIQASVSEKEIGALITEYRNLYSFITLVNQAYALGLDLKEDGDDIAELKEKQRAMLVEMQVRFLPE